MYETKRLEMIEICKEKGEDYKILTYLKFNKNPYSGYARDVEELSKKLNYYDFALLFFDLILADKKNYIYANYGIEIAKICKDYDRLEKYYEIDFKYNKYRKLTSYYYEAGNVLLEGKKYDSAIQYFLKCTKNNSSNKSMAKDKLIQAYVASKQYDKVIECLEEKAHSSMKYAEAEPALEKLGYLYLHGHFEGQQDEENIVKIDVKKAINYYKKHHKKNVLIGKIYYYGLGGETVDYNKAFKYFEGAYECIELIECYYYGRGVEQNYLYVINKITSLSKSYFDDDKICDMFLDCIEKTNYFSDNSIYLKSSAAEVYHRILARRGVVSSYYQHGYLSEQKLSYYKTNSLIEEYTKEALFGYSKYIEVISKDILKRDNDEKNKYLKAIDFVYKNKDKPVEYLVIKADSNDINYFYIVGKKYALGEDVEKDINKGKYYLNKFIKYYEDGCYPKDAYSDENYVFAYELVNDFQSRNSVIYKEKKYSQGETKYVKEIGLAYFYGNGVNKNLEKAKEYLKVYLNSLSPLINPKTIDICKEYIYIFDLVGGENKIFYNISKAVLGESKYYYEVGKYYKEGVINCLKPNSEYAKMFYDLSLKELEKYVVEDNPNIEKVKEYIQLFNEIYPNGENRAFKFYLAYAIMDNPRALFTIGVYYEYGDQVEKNIDKALHYFQKSADLNYEPAIDKINAYKYQKEREENENKLDVIKAVRYIQLLELNEDEDITEEDVKNAYKQLSRIYHPDISNKRYTDGKKFIELKDAHDYLLKHIDQIRDLVTKYFK